MLCRVCVWVRIQQVYAPNNTLSVSYGKKKKKEKKERGESERTFFRLKGEKIISEE